MMQRQALRQGRLLSSNRAVSMFFWLTSCGDSDDTCGSEMVRSSVLGYDTCSVIEKDVVSSSEMPSRYICHRQRPRR